MKRLESEMKEHGSTNNTICSNFMDQGSIVLSEVRQRKTNIMWYCLTVEAKKKWYKWTYLQNRNRLKDIENKLMVITGERRKRDKLGVWNWHIHTAIQSSFYSIFPSSPVCWHLSHCILVATHSRVLAWRIPGAGEPGGLPSLGSHRVGHNWSDLAAAF